MACGRPCIYSDLKAIRKGVPEIMQCAHLTNSVPNIAKAIVQYIQDPTLYVSQCETAQTLSKNKYNWEMVKDSFVQLIQTL